MSTIMSQDKFFYNFPAPSSSHYYFFLHRKEDPFLPLYIFPVVTSNSQVNLIAGRWERKGKVATALTWQSCPQKSPQLALKFVYSCNANLCHGVGEQRRCRKGGTPSLAAYYAATRMSHGFAMGLLRGQCYTLKLILYFHKATKEFDHHKAIKESKHGLIIFFFLSIKKKKKQQNQSGDLIFWTSFFLRQSCKKTIPLQLESNAQDVQKNKADFCPLGNLSLFKAPKENCCLAHPHKAKQSVFVMYNTV